MNEESIFVAAIAKKTPQEREAFLDESCQGNAELRAAVEELLSASNAAGSFFEHPPAGLDVTVDAERPNRTTVHSTNWDSVPLLIEPCDKPDRVGKLGAYEIIEVVGSGGMGIVLRAFDTKLSRVVAVKVLAPELARNPTAVKRFLREAKAAAAVVHDHVVTIHNVEETHQPPFLVMQFIDGQTLQQKIDREGALELKEILRIGCQTAAGLAVAHKHGLVHRDVKPANILLENGVERVKITDFGLARAADDVEITQTGLIAGTPQYMSPEQAKGESLDARSDLFSLGSVLYTMCAGRPAFRAETTMGVIRRVCDDEPRPIREVNAELPAWLEGIVGKLLSKSPADRYQSAAEVSELLGQCLAHVQNPGSVPLRGMNEGSVSLAPGSPVKLQRRESASGALAIAALFIYGMFALGLLIGAGLIAFSVVAWYFHRQEPPNNRTWPEIVQEDIPLAIEPLPIGSSADILTSSDWEWTAPENLGPIINTAAAEGGPTLSSDGLTLIFHSDRKGGLGDKDLWSSTRQSLNEPWSEPVNLGAGVNSTAIDSDAALSADGLTLLFSSNRFGGQGDLDLWMCTRADLSKPWSVAVNVAPVNGGNPESAPALSADGLTLIFNSKRTSARGAGDLWVSTRLERDAAWTAPRNMGKRINTPVFQGFAALADDGLSLIFNSNRGGGPWSGPLHISTRTSPQAEWSEPRQLWDDSLGAWSACLTADSQTMLFDSKRAGGQGGFDLWMAHRVRKGFAATPTNAGLVGTWDLIELWDNGVRGSKEESATHVVITGDTLKTLKDGDETARYLYEIDASKNPKQIRLADVHEGGPWLGIYDLQGDTLRICTNDKIGGKRSTAFESLPDSHNDVLFVLQRSGSPSAAGDAPWTPLFNGKDLTGWKTLPEQPGDWRVDNDELVGTGATSHLFTERGDFQDFHLRAEVKIDRTGNSGIFFRAPPRLGLFGGPFPPAHGVQIYNNDGATKRDSRKTGSLNGVVLFPEVLVEGEDWFTLDILVRGDHATIQVNGQTTVDGTLAPDPHRKEPRGHFALQIDRGTVRFRKIEVRELLPGDGVVLASVPAPPPGSSADILSSPDWEWAAPENIGPQVNSAQSDDGPAISADGLTLVFHSDRKGGLGGKDLWSCTRHSPDEPWGEPVNLGPNVNTPRNDSDAALSADGLILAFHSDRPGEKYVSDDLWICTRADTDQPWSPAAPVREINSAGAESAPTLSADGLMLIFNSDRQGSYGTSDLWISTRTARSEPWSSPRNPGVWINHPLHVQGLAALAGDRLSLIFNSSRGDKPWPGPLWISTRPSLQAPWSEPIPLWNSGLDDSSVCLSADAQTLLFASQRAGGSGGLDLWMTRRVRKVVAEAPTDGFVSLFNGKNLGGWKKQPDQPGGWVVEEGVLVGCGKLASGRRTGESAPNLVSERSDYADFHLRAEMMLDDQADGSLFFRATMPPDAADKSEPEDPTGYQIQFAGGKLGCVAGLSTEYKEVKPGEWFTLEIIAHGGKLTIKVNGQPTAEVQDDAHERGAFVIQSVDLEGIVKFRKIEIRELP